jgi:adenosylhomocysteine nucleosidase
LLILGGFGGGLHPDLAIGDVVVEPPPSLTVIEGPWKIGRITTQTDLVATPQAKAALFKRTGAWAVDMEADPVRRAAMSRALPLVVVRAITDTAAQSIDPRILAWIDPDGAPRAAAMALGLLRRPWLIVELIRLGRASRLAGLRLAAAVRHIVDNASEFIRP